MKKYEAPEALTIEFVVSQVIAASIREGEAGQPAGTKGWQGDDDGEWE